MKALTVVTFVFSMGLFVIGYTEAILSEHA